MQRDRVLSWFLLMPLVLVLACGGDSTETGEKPLSPTLSELKNATYRGLEGEAQSVKLTSGVWQGEPFVEGGASAPRVDFVRDYHLLGDLNGDMAEEAVVLLSESSGGSGEFIYLAIVERRDGELENIATAAVGDRVQIRGAWLEGNRVFLSLVQAGPEDAACCPSELATRGWTVSADGALEEIPPEIKRERLSLKTIGEIKWVLREWSWDEPAPTEPEISLVYQDGRISGSGGCNNFFGTVKDRDAPGEVKVGPMGSTQRTCADRVMAAEGRFLRQLVGVKQYGFIAGQLALSYQKDGDWGVMLFDAREPDMDLEGD